MIFREMLHRQPRWLVLLEALLLVGVIGWIDYVTGWELSLFVLYALPIVMVVWKTDRDIGFSFAFLCAVTWWAAQLGSNPFQTNLGLAWAAVGRLFYFAVLVVAADAVKAQRENDRARIEALEHAQAMEREILRTSEREQQRIGRDLHDSLGPHLAAIGYAATFLTNELRKRDQPEVAKAEQIRELVTEAVSLTRDLARGIFPVQMDGTGLATALEDFALTTSRLSGRSVTFCEIGDTSVADPEDGMNLFRIAQEAVNNSVKHGEAKNINILLSKSEESLRLVIADDGRGIAPAGPESKGIGLHSMKYRARALGGEIEFKSNPAEGTIVSCEIPLHPSHPKTP